MRVGAGKKITETQRHAGKMKVSPHPRHAMALAACRPRPADESADLRAQQRRDGAVDPFARAVAVKKIIMDQVGCLHR